MMVRICLFLRSRTAVCGCGGYGICRHCRLQQMRPPQKAGASGINLMKICTANGTSCDEDDIPSRFDCIQSQSDSFAQTAFDAIAFNSIADPVAYRECETAIRQVIP